MCQHLSSLTKALPWSNFWIAEMRDYLDYLSCFFNCHLLVTEGQSPKKTFVRMVGCSSQQAAHLLTSFLLLSFHHDRISKNSNQNKRCLFIAILAKLYSPSKPERSINRAMRIPLLPASHRLDQTD